VFCWMFIILCALNVHAGSDFVLPFRVGGLAGWLASVADLRNDTWEVLAECLPVPRSESADHV